MGKKISQKIKLLLVIMVLIISITGCVKEEIVAKVDNKEITKTELYDQLVAQGGKEALDALISEKIMELEVEKNKIEVSEEEIEKELNEMREYYGGEEELDKAIEQFGYTMDDIKNNITMNLQIEKLLEPYITITDEEMQAYFEENKASLNQVEQVKASHILVESKEIADEVIQKLNEGGNFADLAKEYSKDTMNSQSGGDLGYFGKGEMLAEFENEAFSLGINEISEPVKTNYGYHIIKVEDKKEAKEAVYEDFKDNIHGLIFQEKMGNAYSTWYEEKLTEYEVTNYLTQE